MKDITDVKLSTNLDTNLLKLIGIICMVLDHVGSAFFPDQIIFRCFGRIVFPIFCYCMTVGMLYTNDIKKYLGRLAIFAIISQPFYVLMSHPNDFWNNLFVLNIFFTLLVTLISVWGFKERKWWLYIAGIIVTSIFNLDYSITGIIIMTIFYLCRNKPKLGAVLFIASYLPALLTGQINGYFSLTIGNYAFDISLFSIFATPLIFMKTSSNIKISKWFFYVFYPAHLFIIYLVQRLF